jgi:hypothetical protein
MTMLAQVMVCGSQVGWRKDARKIIIVATDRDFHFALDGKLAGTREISFRNHFTYT